MEPVLHQEQRKTIPHKLLPPLLPQQRNAKSEGVTVVLLSSPAVLPVTPSPTPGIVSSPPISTHGALQSTSAPTIGVLSSTLDPNYSVTATTLSPTPPVLPASAETLEA